MSVSTSGLATLLETRSGRLTLKVNCEKGSPKTLHSLYDPEAEARALVDAFRFDGNGILVVLGVGLGYHVAQLARRFPKADIIVVEAEREIYELAERYGKTRELEKEVDFILGGSPQTAIQKITRRQLEAGMPSLALFSLTPAVSAFPAYYEPIVTRLSRAADLRLWERLKYRKFKEEVLRVALIDFGYFLTREVESALLRLGHKALRVPVGKGEEGNLIASKIIEKIVSFRPDFFLTINHLGFDEEGVLTSFFRSIEMPVASWYVDSPNLIVKEFQGNVSPYTALFLWEKGYVRDMESVGFESVSYLPLATDETVFKPTSGRRRRQGRGFSCEVGFVGNSMVVPTHERMARVRPELHPLVERLAEECFRRHRSFEDLLRTAGESDRERVASLDRPSRTELEAAVLWKTTQRYRLRCINELTRFDLRIHGDAQWNDLLDGSAILSPPIDYYKQLPRFYSHCKINFNATNLQMGAAVNQRVFDVPACGAFLLTDHQEALGEVFVVGKEVIAFEHVEEIPDLVRFYLHNPGKRKATAELGRRRVLEEHTYKHRLNHIIERMRSRYR